MNVASLENCKRLYELSGWRKTDFDYDTNGELIFNNIRTYLEGRPADEFMRMTAFDHTPAYSLDHLIREIPHWIQLGGNGVDIWYCHATRINFTTFRAEADSPEDAACLLAIKLFEEGVLER